MSMEEIKRMVLDYVNRHDDIVYPSDIAEDLNLDYLDVVDALRELVKEGKVNPVKEEDWK